jgi:hypothetical protein
MPDLEGEAPELNSTLLEVLVGKAGASTSSASVPNPSISYSRLIS